MKRTILKPRSEFSVSLPEMKEGDILIHFAPHPQGKKMRYVESNKDKFEIYTEPHWIECGLMEKGLLHDLDLINEHLDEIGDYGTLECESLNEIRCIKEKRIKKKDFDYIGTAERRLIYILYRRLKNDSFLEINLVGLASDSIRSFFRYALDTHDKYPATSYLFIVYTDDAFYDTIENPTMVVSEESINDIFSLLEAMFSYNRKIFEMEWQKHHNSNMKAPKNELTGCQWCAKLKGKLGELVNRLK